MKNKSTIRKSKLSSFIILSLPSSQLRVSEMLQQKKEINEQNSFQNLHETNEIREKCINKPANTVTR